MPRGDRTGPLGAGPRTGRMAGYCSGSSVPGYINPWVGRGPFWRLGRGGRGLRRRFCWWAPYVVGFPPGPLPYQEPTEEEEKEFLKSQAEVLQKELDALRKRLEELEG